MPDELAERTIRYVSAKWALDKGIDFDNVLHTLPIRLQGDIKMALHGKVMSSISFFRKCEPAFIRALVVKLSSAVCLAGDYVFRVNELATCMYFVHEGTVVVLRDNRVSMHLGPSSFFGEKALLSKGRAGRRLDDVRAQTFCFLYVPLQPPTPSPRRRLLRLPTSTLHALRCGWVVFRFVCDGMVCLCARARACMSVHTCTCWFSDLFLACCRVAVVVPWARFFASSPGMCSPLKTLTLCSATFQKCAGTSRKWPTIEKKSPASAPTSAAWPTTTAPMTRMTMRRV